MKIRFEEAINFGYSARTEQVLSEAHAVLDFCRFESGSGGVRGLTKRCALWKRIPYFQVIDNRQGSLRRAVRDFINWGRDKKDIVLNIAGNGLHSSDRNQPEMNILVRFALDEIRHNNIDILEIISGGQTGYDEAGIHAALRMGIPVHVIAPKEWTFRTKMGTDIRNEEAFKARFKGDLS